MSHFVVSPCVVEGRERQGAFSLFDFVFRLTRRLDVLFPSIRLVSLKLAALVRIKLDYAFDRMEVLPVVSKDGLLPM